MGVTLKCFSPGALQGCGIRWKSSTSCLCGQVPGRERTISLPAPSGLSIQPMCGTTCSTTAPDGATLGPSDGVGVSGLLVYIKCLWATRKWISSAESRVFAALFAVLLNYVWRNATQMWSRTFDSVILLVSPSRTHTHIHLECSVASCTDFKLNLSTPCCGRPSHSGPRSVPERQCSCCDFVLAQTDCDVQVERSKETEGVRCLTQTFHTFLCSSFGLMYDSKGGWKPSWLINHALHRNEIFQVQSLWRMPFCVFVCITDAQLSSSSLQDCQLN